MSYCQYKENKNDYISLNNYINGGGNDSDPLNPVDQKPNDKSNEKPQKGWFATIGDFAYNTVASGLVYTATAITGIGTCEGYYNKDAEGKYTTYYDFNNMDQMNEFLDYVFDVTHEFNKDTILYYLQMKKVNGYVYDVPKIITLLLNCKLQKSKLLEMIFSKNDVEKYTAILNGTFVPGAERTENAINTFVSSLPKHVLDSIKNILDIGSNNEENIWDSYSTMLSFIGCILDTSLLESWYKVNDLMRKRINDMDLPICFMYFDLLFDKKFSCSRNVNKLYTDFLEKKQYRRIAIPADSLELYKTRYIAMNNMTLGDFFKKDKNFLCSLPPSVLFLLLVKINPKINEPNNYWNQKLKKLLEQMHVECKGTIVSETEKTTIETLTDRLNALNQEMQKEKCTEDQNKKLSSIFSSFRSNKSTKAMQTEKCNHLLMNKKIIDESIKEIEKIGKVDLVQKVVIPSAIKLTASDTIKSVCDNKINWGIFDGLLTKIYTLQGSVFKLFNFADNKIITHSIIQTIAGFITFLPIDLKQFFHELLRFSKKDEVEYFDKVYDAYRKLLYEDFTGSQSKQKQDPDYHYLKYLNKNTKYPLFPPQELLDDIKTKMLQ